MSGPSAQQIQLEDEQQQFYQQGMQEATANYGEQQDLLAQMEAVYNPILAKGPNQPGFSPAEQAALDAQAEQGTAANYSQAARAVGENIAAEGGGNNPLPAGGGTQLKEEVGESAAGQESAEEEQILQASYATGEKEFENAGSELTAASNELNPSGYETAATGEGSAAETTANQINQEKNSWMAPVLGALGSIGSGAMSKLGSGGGGGGSPSSGSTQTGNGGVNDPSTNQGGVAPTGPNPTGGGGGGGGGTYGGAGGGS
jgi:hypothetical protein